MSVYRCISLSLCSRNVLQRSAQLGANTLIKINEGSKHQITPQQCFIKNLSSGVVLSSSSSSSVREYSKKASSSAQRRAAAPSSSSSSDSDSDRGTAGSGKRGKYGQTPFWRQKMRTHHQVLDINKDGVVSWDDFETLVAKFKELGHLSQEELVKFTDALRHVWEEEWGASGDPYVFIGQEQFLTQMEHVVNTKDLRKRVAKPLPYFFKAVDRDGSGEISIEEFTMFYACLGLSEEAAAESFAAIDQNGDGTLTVKEFVKLGREFFLSEDETRPSKLFWGPLSD